MEDPGSLEATHMLTGMVIGVVCCIVVVALVCWSGRQYAGKGLVEDKEGDKVGVQHKEMEEISDAPAPSEEIGSAASADRPVSHGISGLVPELSEYPTRTPQERRGS